jgi:hypothetical protein
MFNLPIHHEPYPILAILQPAKFSPPSDIYMREILANKICNVITVMGKRASSK